MRRAMSTYVFVEERLHPGLLDTLVRGGAQAIEIFCSRGHFDYSNKAHVKEIAGWFSSTGVELHSLHSPMYSGAEWGRDSYSPPVNIIDTDKRRRIEALDEIKRALEVAETLPFKFLVQHIGTGGEDFDERRFENAMSSLEHLRAFAKPLGVNLLVENIPNEISTPEKIVDLLKTLHYEDIGVCFDLGHAHMAGGVFPAFELLKDRIRSTHVHDNAQDKDAHLWPGKGTIDWADTMKLLRSARHVPPVLLEVAGAEGVDVSRNMAEAYRMMEGVTTTAG